MIAGRIEGATHCLGAPAGWEAATEIPCGTLPVRFEIVEDGAGGRLSSFVSAWLPTPEQLERIAAGAPVLLRIIGTSHPPVAIDVGQAPE